MLLDHDPPDIGDAPYTVSNGVAHKVAMPVFGHVTGPAINGPNAKRPSDSALGFDPAGAPQWRAALMHPLDAIKGKELSVEASNLTKSLYPGEPSDRTNNTADAFRHAYWNYAMTKAFGPAEAQLFGSAHEISFPNAAGERYMDLYNNQIGRNMAATGRGNPIDSIRGAIANGQTRNSPF